MSMRKRRQQKVMDTNKTVMGVAWYRRDQWNRLLEISSDRVELEDTYGEWKTVAEENLGNLAKHGYKFRKVAIDVEELLTWCNSHIGSYSKLEFQLEQLK